MAELYAVADTSPIIALVGLGELRLVDALFPRVAVPFAVWEELADKPDAPELEALRALQRVTFLPAPLAPSEAAALHTGEAAAIALAMALPTSVVVLDDLAARKVAGALGLRVVGTLGILLEAKRRSLIPSLRPLVERMIGAGYRLGPNLVRAVLRAANEG